MFKHFLNVIRQRGRSSAITLGLEQPYDSVKGPGAPARDLWLEPQLEPQGAGIAQPTPHHAMVARRPSWSDWLARCLELEQLGEFDKALLSVGDAIRHGLPEADAIAIRQRLEDKKRNDIEQQGFRLLCDCNLVEARSAFDRSRSASGFLLLGEHHEVRQEWDAALECLDAACHYGIDRESVRDVRARIWAQRTAVMAALVPDLARALGNLPIFEFDVKSTMSGSLGHMLELFLLVSVREEQGPVQSRYYRAYCPVSKVKWQTSDQVVNGALTTGILMTWRRRHGDGSSGLSEHFITRLSADAFVVLRPIYGTLMPIELNAAYQEFTGTSEASIKECKEKCNISDVARSMAAAQAVRKSRPRLKRLIALLEREPTGGHEHFLDELLDGLYYQNLPYRTFVSSDTTAKVIITADQVASSEGLLVAVAFRYWGSPIEGELRFQTFSGSGATGATVEEWDESHRAQ